MTMKTLGTMRSLTTEASVPEGMTLYTEKVITLFSMTFITFLFGMLPLKLFSQLRNNTDVTSMIRWRLFISFCSCFAGGVFIAACLLDLLPDVEESFKKVLEEIKDQYKVDFDYPVAQFVIVFGFFVILTIEQTVLHFQEQWALDAEREPLLSRRRRNSNGSTSSYSSMQGHIHHHQHSDHDHGHGHGHSHAVFNHSSLRSIMLLIALSFHSVFEGLAIGLQNNTTHLMTVFIAVITHKAV